MEGGWYISSAYQCLHLLVLTNYFSFIETQSAGGSQIIQGAAAEIEGGNKIRDGGMVSRHVRGRQGFDHQTAGEVAGEEVAVH